MDANAMETVLQLAETINGRQHAGLRIDPEDWSALHQACAEARADAAKLAQREAASREVAAAAKALLANCVANAYRYDAALNRLGISPNGDDYNAIFEMLAGADYRNPHKGGR